MGASSDSNLMLPRYIPSGGRGFYPRAHEMR